METRIDPASASGQADLTLAEFRASVVPLLVERVQAGLRILLAALLLFAAVQLNGRAAGADAGWLLAIKLVQLLTLVWALAVIERRTGWRAAVAVALVVAIEVSLTTAATGTITGDVASTFLLAIVMQMATASLLPWGAVAQSLCVAAGLGAAAAQLLLHGAGFGTVVNEVVAATLAGVTSIVIAAQLEQRRFALAASEQRLRNEAARSAAIIAAALDPIVTMDRAGLIVEFNPAAERTFGYARAEAIGHSVAERIIPPALRRAHQHGMERYLTTGEGPVLGTRVEVTAMRADGQEFPVELAITPIGAGDEQLFTAYIRDLTDRRLAEEAHTSAALVRVGREMMALLEPTMIVERLQAFSRELLPCASAATFLLTADGGAYERSGEVHTRWPERVARTAIGDMLAQLERTAVVTGNAWLGWTREAPAAVTVALRRVDEIIGLHVLTFADGSLELGIQQQGLLLGMAQAAGMALTNARLVSDLTHASRIKSEFLSTMSHELRTPLNAILGYAEMAKDPDFDVADRTQMVGRIETAGRGLLELIEGALDIGRAEAGDTEVDLRPFGLKAWWGAVRDSCGVFPRDAEVVLAWSEPPDVVVRSDPRKLAVVLRNLVGNALKFTHHGLVQVEAAASELAVVIAVKDTGIGIRPEDREIVFEMFRQADGSESRRYGGAGLGLHIVRRFVEQLGGTVALESQVGHGSTFTLALPIDVARAA